VDIGLPLSGSVSHSPLIVSRHALGSSFLRAPSPSKLPLPPTSWAARSSAAKAENSSSSSAPPPVQQGAGLQRSAAVVRELHGNLLLLTLSPRFPTEDYGDLAGKITGMLLEGLEADEIAGILASEQVRDDYIQEALEVLRDDGDGRAVRALAPPPPSSAPLPGVGLTVDVGGVHQCCTNRTHRRTLTSMLTLSYAPCAMRSGDGLRSCGGSGSPREWIDSFPLRGLSCAHEPTRQCQQVWHAQHPWLSWGGAHYELKADAIEIGKEALQLSSDGRLHPEGPHERHWLGWARTARTVQFVNSLLDNACAKLRCRLLKVRECARQVHERSH